MSKKLLFILPVYFLLCNSDIVKAQSLSANVLDSITKAPIPYVTVLLNNKGVITNEDGNFNFMLDETVQETDSLFISCIGYKSVAKPLSHFFTNTILLSPKAIELREVIVSNKNYTADEIMELVNDNLNSNYNFDYTKKRLFYRNSSYNRMVKTDFKVKESTIKALNQNFIDSIIYTVPKSNSYYTEILGDLYGSFEEDEQKLELIKASELYDKSKEMDMEKLEEKFNGIIKKNVRTDSYFKIKSGLFGTKLDADELFEADIDSTDIAAVNQEIERKQENNKKRKINFANYRKGILGKLLQNLPIHEDTDLYFIIKPRKYTYTLKEFTYLGNDAVYVLEFQPDGSADYRGTLYINADDFALLRADFENIKPVHSFKLLGVSTNTYLTKGKVIFHKQTLGRYALQYFETQTGTRIGVKRPLKIIEKNKVVKGRNKQNELSGKMDLVFTDIEKNELVVFDTKQINETQFNAFEENHNVLPTYMPKYDPNFWKGHTIMEPNMAIKEFTSSELE
ncbi:carboxypeptidase-like regulatory domain-containing protein [Maribacter confluentis]|uniref:Carboxypeptidase-like regulatory domain-containing protein n=1 Tax=Maribacter confluentis TaxID=1656093 RepID=A0ABT8RR48_9FLAO|nr:carboxypeptidase-like regulatory domain-containing protein [Maribacter confluentis]MDO1513145.1 carboxypeptidase-like regulatory domain-containing protein [Maribacter confluentis]